MGFEIHLEGGTHSAGVGWLRVALSPSCQCPESSLLALGPMVAVTPGGIILALLPQQELFLGEDGW